MGKMTDERKRYTASIKLELEAKNYISDDGREEVENHFYERLAVLIGAVFSDLDWVIQDCEVAVDEE